MMFVRLLPVFFAAILFAAHLLRFYGLTPAVIVFALLFTLFVRKHWILRGWQVFLTLAGLIWIKVTVDLVQLRLATGMPWLRLMFIMAGVVLFTFFSAWFLENKKTKAFYGVSKGQ